MKRERKIESRCESRRMKRKKWARENSEDEGQVKKDSEALTKIVKCEEI